MPHHFFTFLNDDGRSLIFELTVTDSGGLQSNDSTTVSIRDYEKDYPGASGGGCFVATAAYGSPTDSHVISLREFRDRYLLHNPFGNALADLYYRCSPPLANLTARHESTRIILKLSLLPVVGLSWMALELGLVPMVLSIVLILALLTVSIEVLARMFHESPAVTASGICDKRVASYTVWSRKFMKHPG